MRNYIENTKDSEISLSNLKKLRDNIHQKKRLFNQQKDNATHYSNCNSIKVKKVYKSIDNITKDNNENVLIDDRFKLALFII